jgi:16S rRNA G966 N2-methylase RsmD
MAKKITTHEQLMFSSTDTGRTVISYSGDAPNPELRQFVERYSHPYEPDNDGYRVAAFNKAITSTKATAIYLMHSYHQGKKPHDAIREYIRHYTQPGDTVLDPFSGSGGTALAASLEGRIAIAIDRSPASTFITSNYCSPIDPAKLRHAFQKVSSAVQTEMDWLYGTKCDRCNGDATVIYTVYSQVFQCPRCLQKVTLFDCVAATGSTGSGKPKKVNVCPYCHKKGHTEVIRSQSEKFGHTPVLTAYACKNRCSPPRDQRRRDDSSSKKARYFEEYDLARLREIDDTEIPYPYPKGYDMSGFSRYQRDALFYYDVREVADLFTKRNLWAIALLKDAIKRLGGDQSETLLFALTAIMLNCSRMYRYRESLKGGFQGGTYYVPQESQIINVFRSFGDKVEDLIRAASHLPEQATVIVSTQSACDLTAIPSNSVDYVFTDPPYSHTIQYGELNYVWEAWLGFKADWHEEEIIVNEVRNKSEADWAARMRLAMGECYRVLKPGRWLSLCYHDTSEGTWELVQDVMAEVGFIVDKTDSALFIDTGQKSMNQLNADKSTKRDLVLNFRKPKPLPFKVTKVYGPEDADKLPKGGDIATFGDTARQVVRDFLTRHPGATKDRIYDELVSRLVGSRSMEAHDFDRLLKSVAEEVQQPVKEDLFRNKEPDLWGSHVQSRWYLKETADQVDQAEQAKEDAAATRLSKFMGEHLKKRPELEGVHYSDLFEQYLPVQDKPRRLLADWLPEYFIKTPSGTWRLPDKEEAGQLAQLREQGTLRRIKRFANALIDGVPIRDKDRPGSDVNLLDWLRQCRRAGLYEQGRAIYEKGGLNLGNLSDEQQIEAEDDYRICVRRGSDEEAKPKRKSRKKQADDE